MSPQLFNQLVQESGSPLGQGPITCSARPISSSRSYFQLQKPLRVAPLEVLIKLE